MYTRTRERGLRRRGQAPHHDRHVRALRGYYDAYYGRAQKVRTLIREDFRRAFESVRLRRHADLARASRSSSARRPTTRSRCTSTTSARCRCPWPASRRSRSPRALRGPAGRLPARRPGVQREPHARRGARARAGDRLRRVGAARGMTELRARHRAGDPRPARDAHEDVLRLRAELRRGAQHPHLPGLPRAARGAAGGQRARRSSTG